jgi:hypothetical protein
MFFNILLNFPVLDHFVNLSFRQVAISPNCHFVNLSLRKFVISSAHHLKINLMVGKELGERLIPSLYEGLRIGSVY